MDKASESSAALASAVACPQGFVAGGLSCGIKRTNVPDLALILCPQGAHAAAMFTRNHVKAAPVLISQQRLEQSGGTMRALLINSGCANAATGEDGHHRATRALDELAQQLGAKREQVLMNSTGVIGEPLPDDSIVDALPRLIESCSAGGVLDAATAIMTTDTKPKVAEREVRDSQGRTCRVVGIAKGSGMIHPNMATMIAVVMTDATAEPPVLRSMLREAVERSFHRISVDGDTSTNDSVFLLASGAAGEIDHEQLADGITAVASELAEMIVRDGEGASKLIRVVARGAATPEDARRVAETVATSLLVRTSIAGGDANWGRLLMAAGRSGALLDPDHLTISVNGMTLYAEGRPQPCSQQLVQAAYDGSEIELAIDLHQGEFEDQFLTCDLTEQYVRINADYRS